MTSISYSLLLLNYHRCLSMTPKALELCVVGGRVYRSWYMGVVSHGYGEFGGARDGGDGWYAFWTKPGGSHVWDAGALPDCEVMSPSSRFSALVGV